MAKDCVASNGIGEQLAQQDNVEAAEEEEEPDEGLLLGDDSPSQDKSDLGHGEEQPITTTVCACRASGQAPPSCSHSTLRSRRQRHRRQEEGEAASDKEEDEVTAPPTRDYCCATAVRFHVPQASSSPPHQVEQANQDEHVHYQLIRLSHACEAACAQILGDWPNTNVSNNNVDKGVSAATSSSRQEEDHPGHCETDDGRRDSKQEPSTALDQTHLSRKYYYYYNKKEEKSPEQAAAAAAATAAKELLELVVFTCVVVCLVQLIFLVSKLCYMRTTRNSQDAIYPVLRTMRITSLALLFNYPHAQELYEDACIVHNPFYELNDVSCWPCESVRHVMDFTGFSNFTSGYYQSGIPFIVKDALTSKVELEHIYQLLENEPSNLTSLVPLQSTHGNIATFVDLRQWLGNGLSLSGLHLTWKVNRAQYARLLRSLFRRPYYIPQDTEISVQHFLFIDEQEVDTYTLPLTEFANVFLMQGDGRRLVVLNPVRHCQTVCKPIRVLLEPQDVLYYNWLFWRPLISPAKTARVAKESLSITYMGSFY